MGANISLHAVFLDCSALFPLRELGGHGHFTVYMYYSLQKESFVYVYRFRKMFKFLSQISKLLFLIYNHSLWLLKKINI